ncbi:MAG: hypothetical protein LBT80_08435 [Lactobacillaceae bacterium]|jgi:hypothetical protein|nr:hypothetical protein [Lactobacillaceae bacterium]
MKYINQMLVAVLALGTLSAGSSTAYAVSGKPPNQWTGDPSHADGGYWGDNLVPEDKEGQTEVQYEITSSYTITIPATLRIDTALGTGADNVTLSPHPKLEPDFSIYAHPTSASAWKLSLDDDQVSYDFGDEDNSWKFSGNHGSVVFPEELIDGTNENPVDRDVLASVYDSNEFKYAGTYTDIIVWQIAATDGEDPFPEY